MPVRDIQADLSQKHLTASLYGRGVWVLETAGLSGLTAPATGGKGAGGGTGNGHLPATGIEASYLLLAAALLATAAALTRRQRLARR